MKRYIEELVKRGLPLSEAVTIVRNISEEAFNEGCDNISYFEEWGYVRDSSFEDWFDSSIKDLK